MTHVDDHPASNHYRITGCFSTALFTLASRPAKKLWHSTQPIRVAVFRGSIVALDEKTGAMLWKTFDMPDNGGRPGGYSGGAIWQPPAIDPKRGTLFIGTGNNYNCTRRCGRLARTLLPTAKLRRS